MFLKSMQPTVRVPDHSQSLAASFIIPTPNLKQLQKRNSIFVSLFLAQLTTPLSDSYYIN